MDHMAAKAANDSGLLTVAYRLVRDTWIVLQDMIWWLCRTLWRFNKGAVRIFMPGQSRAVLSTVTAFAVLLEVVGLWVAASYFVATH